MVFTNFQSICRYGRGAVFPALTLALGLSFVCHSTMAADEISDLNKVESILAHYPPVKPLSEESYHKRREVSEALDKFVNISVNPKTSDHEFEELKELAVFYHRQVDSLLEYIESACVTDGVLIGKLYSSSVVIKSSEGTIVIDFQEGPVRANSTDPAECDPIAAKTGFLWTSEQLDRLADLVDVSFITHIHPDHASFSLSRRMVERGKPVVVTPELKAFWSSLAHGLVLPDYNGRLKIGPAEFLTKLGYQYMKKTSRDSEGREVGEPSGISGVDAETNVYLIRIGGETIFHAAENNDVITDWLSEAAGQGFRSTLVLSTGMRQGGRATEAFLAKQPPFLRLPIHEYEMTHPRGGNRTAGIFKGKGKKELLNGHRAFLFWGETLVLPGTEKPTKSEPQ